MRPLQVSMLLTLATLVASAYAAWRARRNSHSLDAEGLEDVGRSMRQLAVGLSLASAAFWITVVWLWLTR